MNRAAFFDMDRTLVRVNTAALYMKWEFAHGRSSRAEMARVAWWMLQYSLGIVDAEAVARAAAVGLRGQLESDVAARLRGFVDQEVTPHIAARARAEVARRRSDGYLTAVLTSSTPYSAQPLADQVGIEHVLASRLEVIDGAFTGEYLRPLCYGAGKVALAERWAIDHGVDLSQSAFFTDSISDRPMMERVGEPVVVNPDPRLRLLAVRRAWRTERW